MLTTSSEDDPSFHLADLRVPPQRTSDRDSNSRSDASDVSSHISRRGELQKNWALLRKLHRATLVARQQHFPSNVSAEANSGLEALKALQEVAKRGETEKAQPNWQSRISISTTSDLDPLDSYAAPLAPLRDRDSKALSAWFEREDMDTIAADVTRRLLQLVPEPCWEDDPFDFLKEFL